MTQRTMKRQHHVSYGYRWIKQGIVVVSEEVEIVQYIYLSYISGVTQGALARILTERKVPTPNNTKAWNVSTIRRILTNRLYCGDDYYPQIIEKETYEKALQIRNERNKNVNYTDAKKRNKKLLHNRLFCSICGKPFERNSRRGLAVTRVDWMCPDYLNEENQCNSGYIDENELCKVFLNLINDINMQGAKHIRPAKNTIKNIPTSKIERTIKKELDRQGIIEDTSELKELIQELANYYYERANLDGRDYAYKNAKKFFNVNKGRSISEFDEEVFKLLVEKVIIYPNSTISFELTTGVKRRMKFNQKPRRKHILIAAKKTGDSHVA